MSKELLALLQQIRVRKYASGDPKKIIHGIVEEIKMKTGHYGYRSWEMMVEYLARWLVIHDKTGLTCMKPLQGFKGLSLERDALYEHLEGLDYFRRYYEAAKAQRWDHIGEVYIELNLVGPGQNLTPRNVVELMTKMNYSTNKLDGEAEFFCYESYRNYVLWHYLTYHAPPAHLKTMEPPIHTQLDILAVKIIAEAKTLCGDRQISHRGKSNDAKSQSRLIRDRNQPFTLQSMLGQHGTFL